MRILVVEDEVELNEAIVEGLRLDGYAVDACFDGEEAYDSLFVENYDLVLLDLNLPKMDGFEVIEKIRNEKPDLKILIVSARESIDDKVNGLDLGANDYLVKPFDFKELEARIRNLLRRKFIQEQTIINYDTLSMNLENRIITINNIPLNVTKKEFSLLEYLLLNQNRIVSQEELIEHIWDKEADIFSNAVRVHMATLRKKLTEALGYNPIITRIKEGYMIEERKKNDA